MFFKKILESSKLSTLLSNMEDMINENVSLKKIESGIREFIEIERFGVDSLVKGDTTISVYGEFYGGEKGVKHITLSIDNKIRDKILVWLNKNIKKINRYL